MSPLVKEASINEVSGGLPRIFSVHVICSVMKKFNLISKDLEALSSSGVIPDFFVSLGNLLFSHTFFSKNILSPVVCLLIGASSGEALRFFSLSLCYHSLTPSYISFGVLTLIQYPQVLDRQNF